MVIAGLLADDIEYVTPFNMARSKVINECTMVLYNLAAKDTAISTRYYSRD